jgi:hypothetical protein
MAENGIPTASSQSPATKLLVQEAKKVATIAGLNFYDLEKHTQNYAWDNSL